MIFDNAEDFNLLSEYWPSSSSRGRILITTRNRDFCYTVKVSEFEVEPLLKADGSELLEALFGGNEVSPFKTTSNKDDMEAVSEQLGGLPLALAQMAGYMLKTRTPPAIFHKQYTNRRQMVQEKSSPIRGPLFFYHLNLQTVWTIQLERIKAHECFLLLQTIAVFDPDRIPLGLFIDAGTREARREFLGSNTLYV